MTSGLDQKLVPLPSGELQPVHFFSDSTIQDSMNKALASVTDKSVLLNLEHNDTGFNAAIATKLNDQWSVVAAFKRDDWGWSEGASVKFSW